MIKIRNLSFSYGSEQILERINLDIKSGEFIGMVGSTGVGKTTFAMCLNGLIPNSIQGDFEGDVWIGNKNTKRSKVFDLAKTVGLVFQDPDSQLFALSVEDEVSFGPENLGLRKDEVKERVDKVLKLMNLEEFRKRETHSLSLGQKQKVCIASILAMDPEVLILDEPTAQLDYRNTKEVYEILRELNRKGKTIIVIEHKVDLLSEYAKRILVLDRGKIVLDGKPKYVFNRVEILEKIGIEIPKIVLLNNKLRNLGIEIEFSNIEEAANKIKNLVG
jgi:energy-coupling factor transport system ATP-binding protein